MAHITDLPEEVLIMILRRLDFCSLNNMYNTCKLFKDLLCLPNVVLVCNMSTNLMATANTLQLDFFKDISRHLRVLNMRGVHDLSKTKALRIFKRLKHLKVLDISYTDLNIPDLVDLYNACPTMTDITVDFKFGNLSVEVTQQHMCQWRALFAHFKNVHFVGTMDNLLCSSLVLHILKDSKLETLQFSIVELENLHTTIITKTHVGCLMPNFDHFAAYLMVKNWRSRRTYRIDETINHFPVISTMQFQNYEYCVIYTHKYTRHMPSVYATPLFKKFFSDNFNVNIKTTEEHAREAKSNLAFLVWNRETTQFDDIFFQKLFCDVKPYFPFFYKTYSDVTCPKSYDWIFINPSLGDVKKINDDDDDAIQEKKRKTSMPNVDLDLDNLLKYKSGQVQLSIIFTPELIGSISLPRYGQYFSKITFIYFHGAIKYTSDFFLNLFQRCHNLETLSIELPALTSGRYALDILHSLQASQSMKNLRLVDKGMDFKLYFDLLSKCKTLENILLLDPKQWDHCDIADPNELIESCTNLYSVCIEAPFAVSAQVRLFQWFNAVKKRCKRPHLKVVINCVSSQTSLYGYDPYMEIFKLNSIKPIKRIPYY